MEFYKDKEALSNHSTTESLTNSTSWLYIHEEPVNLNYNKDMDYNLKSQKFKSVQNCLEKYLKNLLIVNNFLNDECDRKIQVHNENINNLRQKNTQKYVEKKLISLQSKKLKKKMMPKLYKCPIGKCGKEYLSLDALSLHTKLKHIEHYNNFCQNRKNIKNQAKEKIEHNNYKKCMNYECENNQLQKPKSQEISVKFEESVKNSIEKPIQSTKISSQNSCNEIMSLTKSFFSSTLMGAYSGRKSINTSTMDIEMDKNSSRNSWDNLSLGLVFNSI